MSRSASLRRGSGWLLGTAILTVAGLSATTALQLSAANGPAAAGRSHSGMVAGRAGSGAPPVGGKTVGSAATDRQLLASVATSRGSSAWRPEPATYGLDKHPNVSVTMRDGTVISTDVYYPTDPATGKDARGPFPVLLTQTPYGKSTEADTYLVQRGYIEIVADVRGTGDSTGTWNLFEPAERLDGAALVYWGARLPHSSGVVGLFGESYMGITQVLTASVLPKGSPLKAIFPEVTGNDLYRDTSYQGGLYDAAFAQDFYLPLTSALNEANPLAAAAADPTNTAGDWQASTAEQQHQGGSLNYTASEQNALTGGPTSFDGAYWQARNPANALARVVANDIPAFFIGGEYDIFQHGEPLNYSQTQNLWAHRPQYAPMVGGQPTTGKYQEIIGPWYHGNEGSTIPLEKLKLEWYDTWLKHIDTGMANTATPLHLWEIGANRWVQASTYPMAEAPARRLYLGAGATGSAPQSSNDGSLTESKPATVAGSDSVVWTGLSSPCSRSTEQWLLIGIPSASDPCPNDDRSTQAGPSALTYTTAPFRSPQILAGPMDVSLAATSTTRDAELLATIEDVAPSGSSTAITTGALIGSQRALDKSRTWYAPDGSPLLAWHPYTQQAVQPVTPGTITRYDIEIFPTFAELATGHRLRVTISTADTVHLQPSSTQLQNLVGGRYAIQRNATAQSWLELPLAPADAYPLRCSICTAG